MIQFVNHLDIDTEKWDDCIDNASNKLVYAYSWYLDTIAPEWDALVLDDYQAVFPIISNKKFGIDYLYPPFWAQQLGVFSKEHVSKNLVTDFIKAIPKQYKFIDAWVNSYNEIDEEFNHVMRDNYELNLNQSYEQIYEGYSSQTKRNLKNAQKVKLELLDYEEPEILINLFRNNRGKEVSSFSELDYERLKHVMHVSRYRKFGRVYTVLDKRNSICAGAFVLITPDRIIFLFSATDSYGKETSAMTYLIDQIIMTYAGRETLFDFEGSNIEGLARFYSGFGAKKNQYPQLIINRLPFYLKWLKKA